MALNLAVESKLVQLLNDIKLRKSEENYEYLVLKISEASLVVDFSGKKPAKGDEDSKENKKERFMHMVSQLTAEPRYILYDFDMAGLEQIALITWSSDTEAPSKLKMIYASSQKAFKEKCKDVYKKTADIHERSDLDFDNVISILLG